MKMVLINLNLLGYEGISKSFGKLSSAVRAWVRTPKIFLMQKYVESLIHALAMKFIYQRFRIGDLLLFDNPFIDRKLRISELQE